MDRGCNGWHARLLSEADWVRLPGGPPDLSAHRRMDTTAPCEGANSGSIPDERTMTGYSIMVVRSVRDRDTKVRFLVPRPDLWRVG